VRKQVEVLEYQTEIVLDLAEFRLRGIDRTLAVLRLYCLLSHVGNFSAGECFQKCAASQQCRFSGARGTDNGEHLSRLYGKGNILEDLHLSKMLLQVFNF